ncbi:hypothetical protein OIV83_003814 [Microbotryomycetes sp. JL201]|nr:hypothetical protein OIV83_003814 [Microbotryomycetes sp. JL201]
MGLQRIVTVQDDLDLAPLTVKLKQGGSSRGHKGVKSVTDSLKGNQKFWRVANYVLEPLGRREVHALEWDEDQDKPATVLAQVWQHVLDVGWGSGNDGGK